MDGMPRLVIGLLVLNLFIAFYVQILGVELQNSDAALHK
jgi:hypothetical protein